MRISQTLAGLIHVHREALQLWQAGSMTVLEVQDVVESNHLAASTDKQSCVRPVTMLEVQRSPKSGLCTESGALLLMVST